MYCPKCGFDFKTQERFLELGYMLKENKPLFGGLLEGDKWKQVLNLFEMERDGLIRIEEGEGFVITAKGKELVLSI